jgi:hypothetical protein
MFHDASGVPLVQAIAGDEQSSTLAKALIPPLSLLRSVSTL